MINSRLPALSFLKPSGGVAAWNDARGGAVEFALHAMGWDVRRTRTNIHMCVKKALLS